MEAKTQQDLLANFADRVMASNQPEAPVEAPTEPQVEQPSNEEIPQEEVTQEPEREEVVEEQSQEPTEEPEKETKEEEFVSSNDWLDNPTEEAEETKEGNFEVYTEIASALGVESFGDKDTVINHLKELNESKASLEKELESARQETPFANDDIKKANELAKAGGDFNKYLQLSNVDYSSIDDDSLLVELVAKPTLGDNPEQINEWLGGLTPAQKQFEASRLRQELVNRDNQEKQAILKQAADKKTAMDSGIKSILQKKSDMFGLKVTPAMKKKSFDKLTSEKGLFSHIIGKDGNVDYNKAVEAEFILSNFDTIVKNALTNERNKVKGEEFKETTKPNMNQQRGSNNAPKKKDVDFQTSVLDSLRNQQYRGK
jgi:hypothetical protein